MKNFEALTEFASEQLQDCLKKEQDKPTCRSCSNRVRVKINGNKVFSYCNIRSSGRTSNGHMKVRCKDTACKGYKKLKAGEKHTLIHEDK
jgi:hypothetical protein